MPNFITYYIDSIKCISEEIHSDITNVLDGQYPAKHKLNLITKKVRQLISNGQDTGLENDKPKRGSSRAVYFPKDKKPITIDGIETAIPTAIKIAFQGSLDNDTGSDRLLGEHQNEHESDSIHYFHAIIRNIHNRGYTTNLNGVIAPVLSSHPEHHWLEMPRAPDLTKSKFRELTKTKDMPQGMDFEKFCKTIMINHDLSLGQRPRYSQDKDHDAYMEHPLTNNVLNFSADTDTHPGDITTIHNWGVFTHPITGKQYPVIRDYGYNSNIAKLYHTARYNNKGVFS